MVDMTTDRYAQAAKASWIAPLVGIAFALATRPNSRTTHDEAVMTGLICLGIHVASIVLAIYARSGISRRGSYGILPQATIGLFLSGLIIAFNFIGVLVFVLRHVK